MAPDIKSGIYESRKDGNKKEILFAYKGEGPKIKNHPYFNVLVYFPDGKQGWYMEEEKFISKAKKLDQEEIDLRIENLSQGRQTAKKSQLLKFLKDNRELGESSDED